MTNLEKIRKELSPARRKKIDARVAQLIDEELTLQELRKAHHKTQTEVARDLGLTQDQVSRLERRSDVLMSTLRKYVESMGGRLSLIAEFPDHGPIRLGGLAELAAQPKQKTRQS